MKRRSFLKKIGLAAVGTISAPYILPSGRLFAATGVRKANHVVFCLFAGGVRNLDSIHKQDGNLMTNMLNGNESISPDILPAMEILPLAPLAQPMQNYGTLFKEFRYGQGPTGHYNGHTTAITGQYTHVDLNVKEHPAIPTVFELYRKHNSPQQSALNCWWIANTLGPYPALNYSNYPGYGAAFGANFIAPTQLITQQAFNVLGNMKTFNSNDQDAINKMRTFFNNNFSSAINLNEGGIINTSADAVTLQNFIADLFSKAATGQFNNPWNVPNAAIMNNDMYNIVFAEEIIKTFKPELVVVNMQDVDICHSNFTSYANNLRKADFACAHLWHTIQTTPGMANDTIMIVAPEHGRNLQPNSIIDAYGRYAVDHTSDATSREIFCLVAGPPGVVLQGQSIDTVNGESIDIVPTIANILGFDTDVPGGLMPGSLLQPAFI